MAKNSSRFQIIGNQQALGNQAEASPSSDPASGTFQLLGTAESLGRQSIQSPSSNPPSGEFQIVGDSKELSRQAVKGWGDAAKLVMSERVYKQEDNAAIRGKRRK